MVQCLQCGREFAIEERVAFICGSIMGDEYVESYFLCPVCRVYTVEIYHDRFLGEDSVALRGPVEEAEGNVNVSLIRECPDPADKNCPCRAHKVYFWGKQD